MAEDFTLELPGQDAIILAYFVVARHLERDTDWVEWADLPYLSEEAWSRLDAAITRVCTKLATRARLSTHYRGADLLKLAEEGVQPEEE